VTKTKVLWTERTKLSDFKDKRAKPTGFKNREAIRLCHQVYRKREARFPDFKDKGRTVVAEPAGFEDRGSVPLTLRTGG
jgi:hypothetical protein